MRIKILKILAVLIISIGASSPLVLILLEKYWWVQYIIALIICVSIHKPVSKWIEENAPR